MVFQYRRDMKDHRVGYVFKDCFPKDPSGKNTYRCMIFCELFRAFGDGMLFSATAVAVLLPPKSDSGSDDTGNLPSWIVSIIRTAQAILLWINTNPIVNSIIFGVFAVFGCFLFVHRMIMFKQHGVRVNPLTTRAGVSGGRAVSIPLVGEAVSWMTGGGWYHQGCDDKCGIGKHLLRNRFGQLICDMLLLHASRFLVSAGGCVDGGVPFDSMIGCNSAVQWVLVPIAGVASLGWYVWVTMLILRLQNHYPLTEQSGLGNKSAPEDMYSPFFLLASQQAKIFLGGVTAVVPIMPAVLPTCLALSLGLFVLSVCQHPCRFKLANYAWSVSFATVIAVTIAAWCADPSLADPSLADPLS